MAIPTKNKQIRMVVKVLSPSSNDVVYFQGSTASVLPVANGTTLMRIAVLPEAWVNHQNGVSSESLDGFVFDHFFQPSFSFGNSCPSDFLCPMPMDAPQARHFHS